MSRSVAESHILLLRRQIHHTVRRSQALFKETTTITITSKQTTTKSRTKERRIKKPTFLMREYSFLRDVTEYGISVISITSYPHSPPWSLPLALSHALLPESFLDRLEKKSCCCPVMLPSWLLHPSLKSSSEKLKLIAAGSKTSVVLMMDKTVGSSSHSPA